ncbi:phospholipid/glycerol acyltransferase domain protein [Mycobacterium kansasii]|uniref:Phospholipid/glycerol acyltransferase domain protein n=1 Tax=Mycobacterium kansasii TaxID=1768 RepID=A0A1V3WZJ2_MYCKA|nr:phospholipid/glycerol acyltransferase domain protein [Mycobacterium kansasii]
MSPRPVAAAFDAGCVDIDVLLTGKPHQLVHHLVGDGPFDEVVAGQPLEPGEIHRLAETNGHPAEPQHLLARRVDDIGADHRHRNHRNPGVQRQPRQAGLSLVEATVGRPGAFGVHAQQLAPAQQALRGFQGGLCGVGVGAVDGHLSGDAVEPAVDPALEPGAGEVFGLCQKRDPAADYQRKVEAVRHGKVVTGEDCRPGTRNVF